MACNARRPFQTLPVAQGQTAMYTNTGMQMLSTLPSLRPHLMLALQAQAEHVIRTICWDAVRLYRCKADRKLLPDFIHASTVQISVMWHYTNMPASDLQHKLIEQL